MAVGIGNSTMAMAPAADDRELCAWQRRVDEICDRFEELWEGGTEPRIEEFLDACELPGSRRAALLCELLKIERELRQQRGEQPVTSEYLRRFSEHAGVVRAVFGETHLGPYELIGLIGEGGMGSVYRAYDAGMRRIVALKVIRTSRLDDSGAQTRFQLEAQLAARLDHEHIVPVYGAGQEGSQLFYTMRLIQGRNLAEVIDHTPMENRRAATVIAQVARAVHHAHAQQILHRDVKPSNILIDDSDRAFITDFGLAKVLDQGTAATQSTDRLGTLLYMAPEQARNPARAVIESDVYSLGATLYDAITGQPPFQAETAASVLAFLENDEPTAPRKINPRVDRDLETTCLKCLEKEPARRYASAQDLAEDLERYLRGEPIQARRIGPVERARKWTRRNPAITGLITVSTLLLLAMIAIVQAVRIADRLSSALESANLGYRKALDSADEIAQFAERRLSDRPDELRILLGIVQKEYGDFLARRRDDPRFARESALVLSRVARILNLFGSRGDALKAHEQALAIRQPLVQDAPDDLELHAALAESWHEIGTLQSALGQSRRAIDAYGAALEIRKKLVDRVPSNRSFLSDLARSHGYIGDLQRESGHRDTASQSYAKALAIRKGLFDADPDDLAIKFQLARSYNNSGYLERELGGLIDSPARRDHLTRALRGHDQAWQLQDELVKLVKLDPERIRRRLESDKQSVIKPTDFQTDLASTYIARGILWTELGDRVKATEEYKNARAILDPLFKEHAGMTQVRRDFARTATYLGELGGPGAALDEADRILRPLVRENPDVTDYRAAAARNTSARGERLCRIAKSPEDAAEGRRLLREARDEQIRLQHDDAEHFDHQADLRRTEAALAVYR